MTKKSQNMPERVSEILPRVINDIKTRGNKPELCLETLPEFNRKIWGVKKKRLTVIGARTSQGKTSFALQVARDLADQGKSVLFLSLEMCNEDILERLVCQDQQVDNYDLMMGRLDKNGNWDKIDAFQEKSKRSKLVVADCIGRTWEDLDKFVDDLTAKPDVIILDYIQTIRKTKRDSKEDIDEYLRHFREMAIRENFAAIVLSQINRANQESKEKTPQIHSLKGSGYIEEHADMVILLHWGYWHDNSLPMNDYQVVIAKNRNGRTGTFQCKYYPQFYLFSETEIVPGMVITNDIESK